MSIALLETPTTEAALREQAQLIERDVDAALAIGRVEVVGRGPAKRHVAARRRLFAELRGAILGVARSPAWRAHDLARELLVALEELRDAIDADPGAADPGWRQREALMRMRVVAGAMVRQLDHGSIDRPPVAARLVAETLADVEVGEVARLLGTTTKSVHAWQQGRVEQIKRNPHRIVLIGQLVYELRSTMTPRGALLWFDAPREQLGGRTPRELIDEDVALAADRLLPLARGGRGQLDV